MEYKNFVEEKRPDSSVYLPGGKAVALLQRTVDSVLLPHGIRRSVITNKEGFHNQDRWTIQAAVQYICFKSENSPVTIDLVRKAIKDANFTRVQAYINVPMKASPTKQKMKALVGGAYHEAFHTLYDFRKNLPANKASDIFKFMGTKIKWLPYLRLIKFWANEICDVMIEKAGGQEYPKCRTYLKEVHKKRAEKLREDVEKDGLDALSAASFAFRHFAFGYSGAAFDSFLKIVKKEYRHIVDLFAPGGKLNHYVESAKDLTPENYIAPWVLTFQLLSDFREILPEVTDSSPISALNREKKRWGLFRIDPENLLDAMLGSLPASMGEVLEEIAGSGHPDCDVIQEQKIINVGEGKRSSKLLAEANQMIRESRRSISYYRSRLRTKIKALEIVRDIHGVDDGVDISEECLLTIKIALADKTPPTHFEWQKGAALDTSTAAYVLFDMSGSMGGSTQNVAKVGLSIMDPLESLGCKTMASGFESGWGEVNHHIFKHWDERYMTTKWRFPLLSALGGTPMAEGMQFSLNALNSRNEGNRLLFIITDGWPNNSAPIPDLIRMAESVGIVVIGIGFGDGAKYVQDLFPEGCHVWAPTVNELPPQVVKKLLQKMSPDKRGHRMKRQVLPNLRWSA